MKTQKRRIRHVTILPGWFLRLKGKIDAKHGSSVVNAYIGRLLKKLCSLESREALETEKELYPTRQSAAKSLATLAQENVALSDTPDNIPEINDTAVRINQRHSAEADSHRNAIRSSIYTIASANEQIINGMTILEERISTMRAKAKEKILQYISGVRKKLPDFNYDLNIEENTAIEIYEDNHRELDEAIRKVAYDTLTEEDDYDD